ncbi:MAG: magnesium/cobalt transporter CorA [Cyclobacteriaceae bacterium]|nr:magnesium/cobalt transporter CorA [Cyclobacteriaceae bacterium]
MARFLKSSESKLGKAPGSLIFVGQQKMEQAAIEVIDYNDAILEVISIENPAILEQFLTPEKVSWVNVYGLHDTALIKHIGEVFQLNSLTLEGILNTGQRPSYVENEDYTFISLKMLRIDEVNNNLISEQFSLVFSKNYLLTFQEEVGDVFEPVRDRLKKKWGRIRQRKSDYLAFALIDTVVDNYLQILERFGDHIEDLEEEVLEKQTKNILERIYTYKREMNYLRKVTRPLKDCVFNFSKSESPLISKKTYSFLKDLFERIVHATEVIEVYRDILNDELNIYHTNITARLNDIIRILTIFTVIFIPVTFLAGIYGTNFEYLPELKYKYAYPIFWMLIVAIVSGMLFFFKRKKWL